jgi:VWFA-related protein
MRNQLKELLVLSILSAAGLCVAVAQQPAPGSQPVTDQAPPSKPGSGQGTPTLRAKSSGPEVLLTVTVHDKRGDPVTSLTSADITLTEDGRPQQIKSFTHDSNTPLRVGLAIDTSSSLRAAMNDERKAVGGFLDQMLPADAKAGAHAEDAFLLHFDREVELLEDFTNSRDKIQHELDNVGPSARESRSPLGPETTDEDRTNGRRRGGAGGTQLYDAIYLAADELMKSKDGRKALIVFSDGEDRGSKETMNDAIDAADRSNVAIYTIYFKGQGQRSEDPFSTGGRRGGVGFPGGGGGYPGGGGGYPGGGGGYPGGGGGRRGGGDKEAAIDGRKIMEKIATRTGGRYYEAKKKENLDDIYKDIANELRNQYVLTYTPDQKINEDEYKKVLVKAKKDDYTVTTREGYYAADNK